MSIKSYDEMNAEQQFAYNAGQLANSQQVAEQQARIDDLQARLDAAEAKLREIADEDDVLGEETSARDIARTYFDGLARSGDA